MKIAIYALHLGVGGVEKYVITLANMLSSQHDVEIVSTYRIQEQPAFKVLPEVKVTYLLENLKPNKEELRSSIKNKNFVEIIKQGFLALKVLWLKRRVNIKSIKKCNSDVIISTRVFHNNLIGKFADKKIVKITGEHNHHNENQKYIQSVIQSCKNFDYFIPISKELCDYYREAMEKNGVETRYIRFCIDDRENIEFTEPPFDKNGLIAVGRLSKEKGPVDLLEVFEKVHEKKKDTILNIVGDGPEYETVCHKIEEKNLGDAVVLHGFRDKQYIYELFPKMSLYVMTSYTESFGIVLLEAMSCGIPCIAYSSAQGAHEIIEDGENGFLIEKRDSTLMARKICDLLSDKKELRRLSKNAVATAQKFSYSNTKKEWLELMDIIGDRIKKSENEEKKYD